MKSGVQLCILICYSKIISGEGAFPFRKEVQLSALIKVIVCRCFQPVKSRILDLLFIDFAIIDPLLCCRQKSG